MEENSIVINCSTEPAMLPEANNVTYSSSSDEVDDTADGRRSPLPKCAICLGKCRLPSYTDTCSHKFCFHCLLEWSKVKPECPLCKQAFCKIAYYKPYSNCQQEITPVPLPVNTSESMRNDLYRVNFYLAEPRYTYHTSLRMRPSQSELLQQLFMHQSSDVQRFVREFGNQPIPSRQNALEWRRFIYEQRLFARPVSDFDGRYRDTSATFYMRNSVQLNRIMPWVTRELTVISPRMAGLPILALMQEYDVDSSSFFQGLNHYVPMQYRAHFQHELVNFARSPYDVIGYDRCVQYDPPFSVQRSPPRQSPRVVISSSEAEDDDIVYMPSSPAASAPSVAGTAGSSGSGSNSNSNSNSNSTSNTASSNSNSNTATSNGSSTTTAGSSIISRRVGRTEFRIETRSSIDTIIVTGTLRDSDDAAPDDAMPLSSASTHTPVIEVNDDAPGPPSPAAGTLSLTYLGNRPSLLRDGDNISLSSSDSDECQFVREQKPPHLRTPDHVVDLESASDSDVVFVDDGPVPAPQAAPSDTQAGPGLADQRESLKNEPTAGAAGGGSCFEYNQGASTSTGGLTGRTGTGPAGPRAKYYVTPMFTRYTGGRGMKSIYEASDSDGDSDDAIDQAYVSPSSSSSSSSHEEIVFRGGQQISQGVPPGRGRKRIRLPHRATSQRRVVGKKVARGRGKDLRSASSSSSSSNSSSSGSRSSSSSSSSSSSNSSGTSSDSSSSNSSGGSRSSSSSSNTSSTSTTGSDTGVAKKQRKLTNKRSRKNRPKNVSPPKEARTKSNRKRKAKPSSLDGAKRSREAATSRASAAAVAAASAGTTRSKSNRRNKSSQLKTATVTTTTVTTTVKSQRGSTKSSSTKGSKRRKAKAKSSEPRHPEDASGGPDRRSVKRAKRQLKVEPIAQSSPPPPAASCGDEWEARGHYFVETRQSNSPDVVDGADGGGVATRARKLKSVIIKRCHYNKKASSTTTTTVTMMTPEKQQPASSASSFELTPVPPQTPPASNAHGATTVEAIPSTSGLTQPPPGRSRGEDYAGDAGRREETAAALMQLSAVASDSGTDTYELDENVWNVLKIPLEVSTTGAEHQQEEHPLHPATDLERPISSSSSSQQPVSEPFSLLQSAIDAAAGPTDLPSCPFEASRLLLAEENEPILSTDSLCPGPSSASVHWSDRDEPSNASLLMIENRLAPSSSSASAEPPISHLMPLFVPSPMAHVSLAGPDGSASPVAELLREATPSLDGDSSLPPSSVVDIGAIGGTVMDELIAAAAQEEDGQDERPPLVDDSSCSSNSNSSNSSNSNASSLPMTEEAPEASADPECVRVHTIAGGAAATVSSSSEPVVGAEVEL